MFYGNAEDFAAYHESRGRTVPGTWDTAYIDAALLVASEWLDNRYDSLWTGYAVDGYEQERKWPRTVAVSNTFPQSVIPDNVIPERVIHATYEAAFREATRQGSLTADFAPQKYKSVRVDGAIGVEYNLGVSQAGDSQLEIPIIEYLMIPLLDPQGQGTFSSLSGKGERV